MKYEVCKEQKKLNAERVSKKLNNLGAVLGRSLQNKKQTEL